MMTVDNVPLFECFKTHWDENSVFDVFKMFLGHFLFENQN